MKFVKILKGIISTLLTAVIVVGIAFVVAYFCGIEPFVIESGSMEPTLKTGSVCFVNKKAQYEAVKVGDVIAFDIGSGTRATHRAVSITDEGIKTKGDNNQLEDENIVTKDKFYGKTLFSIPKIGYIVKVVQTTKGKIIFATFIIVLFLAGIFLGEPSKKNNKKEKNKDIDTENKE